MFIEIQDTDEESFTIDNLEVVFESNLQYICSDIGLFFIDKLSDFKEKNGFFCLTDEENVLELTQEQYNIIKDLFEKKGRLLS